MEKALHKRQIWITRPAAVVLSLLIQLTACGDAEETETPTTTASSSSPTSSSPTSSSSTSSPTTSTTSTTTGGDDPAECEPFVGSAPPPEGLGDCSIEPLPTTPLPQQTLTLDAEAGLIETQVETNVLVSERGGYALHADLFLPERQGTSGALVVVHGGGWLDCENRRDDLNFFAQGVAQILGVPTFNVEYRLAQEGGGYPENVMDVKCAVQWLRSNATEYGIDPDRIGIMGASAGAHLALMVALTEDREDLNPHCGDQPPEVGLTLAYSGPSDLPLFTASDSVAREAPAYYTGESCTAPLEVCSPERACTRCSDASPLRHACLVDDDPVILLQAPDPYDKFVAQTQAELLADALERAGGDVTLVLPDDATMRASGCTPEDGSHASDGCMLQASQNIVNPALIRELGVR